MPPIKVTDVTEIYILHHVVISFVNNHKQLLQKLDELRSELREKLEAVAE
jgi:hypothetical protein